MREIVLQIPTLGAEQNIDIDVRINGRKRSMKYRVEIVDFDEIEPDTDDKVAVLKKVIKEHDKDWELIQIGAPITNNIPIMFRKRGKD
ncbi:MAG: hypothetical protein H8E14_17660 [Candidatus Marinimicrobia bacterium]|nr:hypothetical protein [Candidatus Neomarinimicrobiota bacterium]